MRGLRYCIYVLLIFVMSGCALFVIPRREFKTKDVGERFSDDYNPMINDKFNINGYYFSNRPYFNYVIAFYPNGTYALFNFDKRYDLIGKNVTNLDSLIYYNKKRKVPFIGGIYKVVNDTLIAYEFSRNYYLYLNWAYHWKYRIYKYEILNDSTLRLFESISVKKSKQETQRYNENRIYYFVKASPLPSSFEVEVKTKKWMWDNKNDWKAYMRELKKYQDSKNSRDTVR